MTSQDNGEFFDVVVMGCGPGGSTMSAYLARAGLSVLALEKTSFPRYHIGESLTGMVADVLEDFDLTAEMDRRQFPPKGGVKVIGGDAKHEFFVPVLRPTWQVRRDEFDHILLDHAIQQGATHRYGTVQGVLQEGDHIVGVCYVPSQHDAQSAGPASKSVRCRVVVDASGRGALLSRFGVAGEQVYDAEFSRQVAVFTQFRHARRDPGAMGNNTFLFYGAAHHWAWFIPLSPSLTSVGVVMPGAQVQACGSREAALQWGISQINPDLGWRLEGCEQVETVRAITNYAYAVAPFVGNGWLCVGDAHRFTDPIFSFGVSFAMLEARAASQAIQQVINGEDQREVFADYAAYCDRGQNAAADVIRYFWKFPTFFGYQSRSTLRKDVMRLLASDFHDVDEMRALQVMRRALHRYRTVA